MKKRCVALIIIGVLLLAAVAGHFAAPVLLYKNVAGEITIELGSSLPPAATFMLNGAAADYVDPPELSLSEQGTYDVTIVSRGFKRNAKLITVDTIPPSGEPVGQRISDKTVLAPAELFSSVEDVTPVTAEWITEPAFGKPGHYEACVRLTDTSGNHSDYTVPVTVLMTTKALTAEAGDALPPAASFFENDFADKAEYLDVSQVDMNVPGEYSLVASAVGEEYLLTLSVCDTTPPTGDPVDAESHTGYVLDISSFVENVTDVSKVRVEYAEEPDWMKEGEQQVRILLTDESGNSTLLTPTLTLLPDHEPPELYVPWDRHLYVGEAVSYFEGVKVSDDIDEDVILTVDKSQVDFRNAGDYPVTFTASDHAGNTVEKTVIFHFIEQSVSEEEIDRIIDDILAEIITDDMSLEDKAWAIFCYLYYNVSYAPGLHNHTDMRAAIEYAHRTGFGDCYTYYVMSYRLLSEVGIDVVSVERPPDQYSRHFWCLVNLGTGWYHFDPTHFAPENIPYRWAFMRTTWELHAKPKGLYYWRFDASLYPEVATERYVRTGNSAK